MADPIMDLFDDPGLFADGLDSLTAGSIADDLDLGDGFEPLEPGPELAKVHPFDGLSQFHQPARESDQVPHHHASYAIFSTLKSPGDSFDDQSPLWAQPAPDRGHELQPPPPASQETEYLAHHDYALQQSEQQQQQLPPSAPAPVPAPAPALPTQPALGAFSQAQDALSQGNPFMGVHGAQPPPAAIRKALPPPTPASVETPGFPGQGQQAVSVSSSSSSSSPAQYNIRYSLPGQAVPNGGVVVPPGAVLTSTQGVSYISGNAVFTTAGSSQGQAVQANGPPLNQVLLQPVTAQQTQGNFTTATLTTVKPT